MTYSIHDVSEKTGLSAHVLRYYEKEGLLGDISRSKGGNRVYSDEDLELLGLIMCLKKTGMQLKDIKTFVQLSSEGPSTLPERCGILQRQKQEVLHQIRELEATYEKVSHKLAVFSAMREEYEGKRNSAGKEQQTAASDSQ